MAVIFIGEDESRNQVLVACDQRIRRGLVHQPPRAFQLFPCQVGPVLQEIPYPFLMNISGPSRTEYPG
jgi:hypothetical protein